MGMAEFNTIFCTKLGRDRAGGVAQVVECPSSKHETLRSNPSTAKNKNTIQNQQTREGRMKWGSGEVDLACQPK
jgi:hypothetical protein